MHEVARKWCDDCAAFRICEAGSVIAPAASQLAHGQSSAPPYLLSWARRPVAVQTGCERTPFSRFLLLLHGKTRREAPAHAASEARRRTARLQRVREASGGGARARAWRGSAARCTLTPVTRVCRRWPLTTSC